MVILDDSCLCVGQVLLLQMADHSIGDKAPVASHHILNLVIFEHEQTQKITDSDFCFVLGDCDEFDDFIDGCRWDGL